MRHPIRLALAALLAAAPLAAQHPARAIAVTIDDLPVATRVFADAAAQRDITARLVGALVRQRVPAVGFVNEGKLAGSVGLDTARVGMLRTWAAAGLELGNHTFGHPSLHDVDAATFLRDVDRGDAVTRRVLAESRGRPPRWFRHPYLHTGRRVALRDSVTRHLAGRGYDVAPVTMDGRDWIYAAAYESLLARGDAAGAARAADDYVAYMARLVTYWEGQSRAIVGREIPQVLLLHANALNAATFDRLAAMLRARGYAFVPLADAVADPAYRSPDAYVGHTGISWLHRWARTRGTAPSAFAGEPAPPRWVYEAAGVPGP
jgi:peptidoglycan/xylan/chitin deacetylase (PgdA/CDA1 family)